MPFDSWTRWSINDRGRGWKGNVINKRAGTRGGEGTNVILQRSKNRKTRLRADVTSGPADTMALNRAEQVTDSIRFSSYVFLFNPCVAEPSFIAIFRSTSFRIIPAQHSRWKKIKIAFFLLPNEKRIERSFSVAENHPGRCAREMHTSIDGESTYVRTTKFPSCSTRAFNFDFRRRFNHRR